GSFLVWGPVAIYLLLTGDYLRAAILFFVGVFVIGLIDNLLRPPLVGKDTRLPDYVVLVSTVGGISLLGINGFVIGPLIAALFLAVGTSAASREWGRDLAQVGTFEQTEELGDRIGESDIAAGGIESKSCDGWAFRPLCPLVCQCVRYAGEGRWIRAERRASP